MHDFYVDGTPVGKGRPRFTRVGRVYTPKETLDYEGRIRDAFVSKFILQNPTEQAIVLFISASLRPAQSTSKKKRFAMVSRLIHCLLKPDIDNISKIVLDALNGTLYKDDKQVVLLIVTKQYADEPGLKIMWEEIQDGRPILDEESIGSIISGSV